MAAFFLGTWCFLSASGTYLSPSYRGPEVLTAFLAIATPWLDQAQPFHPTPFLFTLDLCDHHVQLAVAHGHGLAPLLAFGAMEPNGTAAHLAFAHPDVGRVVIRLPTRVKIAHATTSRRLTFLTALIILG